jgi:predicted DNA-binding protein
MTAATTTIRVPATTHERLQRLANEQDRPIGRVIETLLDDFEKRAFFTKLGEDFTRLRADAAASANYDDEVAIWDTALNDGIEDESSE